MAIQAAAQANMEKSEWEKEQERREWKAGEVKLPPFPGSEGLIEFPVVGGRFRFFIDAASLAVGPDGVVRYTLVARSPSGFANITYEGMRCYERSYKVFAFGNDGRWTPRETEWRPIESKSVQSWHYQLRMNYFCPDRLPIETVAEGLDALRSGGHPKAKITQHK